MAGINPQKLPRSKAAASYVSSSISLRNQRNTIHGSPTELHYSQAFHIPKGWAPEAFFFFVSQSRYAIKARSRGLSRPSSPGTILRRHYRGFSLANEATSVRGVPGFSFRQTEPSQGQDSGSFWNRTGEGQQYSHQDHIHAQNGFDTFSSFPVSHHGQTSSQSTLSGNSNQWNASPSKMESGVMSRLPSQESTGAHSQRTNHSTSYDHTRSARVYSNVSHMAYHLSSTRSDVTGGSSPDDSGLYTPTQQMDLQAFESFPFPASVEIYGRHPIFHRDSAHEVSSHPNNVTLTARPTFSMFTTEDETLVSLSNGSENLALHGPVSQESMIYNPSTIIDSPTMWDNSITFLESQRSSPALLEEWALPPPQMMTSTTNSPLDYSPSLDGLSPRYVQDLTPDLVDSAPYTTRDRVVRKPVGPRQSKVASDVAAASRHQHLAGTSETSDDSLRFVGRSSVEIDNTARDHPLYQNVTPKADGFYHCPWEGKDSCQHKPEKLKCSYDKFVDSHLKPYRCKVMACENSRFSSTACLLRHEREAHAMHGHGDKPYMCTYEGCERGVSGNGFPRHWNLRDHMKRVHNDPGPTKSSASGSPPPSSGPTRSKKRKVDTADRASMEKTLKRITTPTIVTQPQEPSLIERYHQSEQRLLEIVKQLHDPLNANNLLWLRSASNCIKVMAQTTQRINAAPALGQNFSQQSG